jgi:hypothetical protein
MSMWSEHSSSATGGYGGTGVPLRERAWETDFALTNISDPARRRRSRRPAAIAGVVTLATALVASLLLLTTGHSVPGWDDRTLNVVGSPVVVGGTVVVLDVTSHHQLEISAVNPLNGAVAWRHPFSASEVTPGVAFGPVALDGTVLDLAPSTNTGDPTVNLEGLDAATGSVMWSDPQLVLSDAPAVCPGNQYFCVAAFVNDTTTALAALDPGTGRVAGAVSGPLRNMTVVPPGSSTEGGLWETYDSAPTLMQVSTTAGTVWRRTVASLLGPGYDPNDGWDFTSEDGLDVGSIGPAASSSGSISLSRSRTIAIAESTGTIAWAVPGYYDCGGGLQFLSTGVVCQYSGSYVEQGTSLNMAGVGLDLRGLDPATGELTWSVRVRHVQSLAAGTDVAFADPTHVVVQLLSGRREVLDTVDGAMSAPGANDVFWCEQNPQYAVSTAQGASVDGKRQGAPQFSPCSASGTASDGRPVTAPSTVGLAVDGLFVWPSPHGLRAVALPS